MKKLLVLLSTLFLSYNLYAADFAVTYDFTAGTDIVASEVNTNFGDVENEINNITSARITDGTITSSDLGSNSVTSAKIVSDAVTAAKVASDVAGDGITQAGDGSLAVNVDGSTLETNADKVRVKDSGITSAKIADGAIVNGDVNSSAGITYSKLSLTGSLTSSDIKDGEIVNADVNPSAAIAGSKLNLSNDIVTGDVVNGTLLNEDINASAAVAGTKVSPNFGSQNVTTTGDVSCSDLQMTTGAASDYILKSDASGNASWSPLGVLSIEDDSITVDKIANGDWGDLSCADNVFTLDDGVITGGAGGKIADGTITGGGSGDIAEVTLSDYNWTDDGEGALSLAKVAFKAADVSGDRDNSLWGYRGTTEPTGVTTAVGAWTDFDCDSYYSGTIPSGEILAIVHGVTSSSYIALRPNGTSWNTIPHSGTAPYLPSGFGVIRTDTNHIFEYYSTGGNKIYFLGYIPITPQ